MKKLFKINNDDTYLATMNELKNHNHWKNVFNEEDINIINSLKVQVSINITSLINNVTINITRIE